MKLTNEEKENIKTYFLIKEGLEITEVTEFYDYLLLKPYDFISFKDKIYTDKKILQHLSLRYHKLTDISPLSSLSKLKELFLGHNKIEDISLLSNLSNLTYLDLENNNISDISPLSTLFNLKILYLDNNNITDISPLSTLFNLTYLELGQNKITDISPLYTLTNLECLEIYWNKYPKEQIKELELKLPNCFIRYDINNRRKRRN